MQILSLLERVENALAEVRPYILSDGGQIELVAIEADVVRVRLSGACQSCPMSSFTLTMGIESAVKERAPEIKTVELVD